MTCEIQTKKTLYNEQALRRLIIFAIVMYIWLLVWALIFKLGDATMLERNYSNLKNMTLEERILWDLIPFNYRGTDYWKEKQMIATALNCLVLAPIGASLGYLLKKANVLKITAIGFLIAFCFESTQAFTTWGNPATEDLITNTLGCLIGYAIYRLLLKRLPLKWNVRLFGLVNILLVLATIVSVFTMVDSADLIYKMMTKTL